MSELPIIEPAAKQAGLNITSTSLGFSDKPTDVQLHAAIRLLKGLERSRQWWWGDFLCAVQQFKGAHYTADLLEDAGVEASSLMHYKSVAEFFKPVERSTNLPWSMHWMSWKVCRGDKDIALNWLQRAEQERWSVRDMQTVAAQIADFGTGDDIKIFRKLTAFERWIEAQFESLRGLPAERRRELRNRLPATVRFIQAISTNEDTHRE